MIYLSTYVKKSERLYIRTSWDISAFDNFIASRNKYT